MTANSFWIGAAWGMRKESPAQLGERFLQSLEALSNISPLFRPWWVLNSSLTLDELADETRTDRGFLVDEARPRMTEIVEMGVLKDDSEYPTPIGGYSVSAINSERSSPRSVSLRVHGADSYGPLWGRGAVFSTAYGQTPDPAIVAYPVFKTVLTTLVSIWDVECAGACSSELSACWNEAGKLRFDLAWMRYLSAPLAQRINPPSDVLVEHIQGGGLLLIAAEETFDTANPKHMAAARSIRDALAPLNS